MSINSCALQRCQPSQRRPVLLYSPSSMRPGRPRRVGPYVGTGGISFHPVMMSSGRSVSQSDGQLGGGGGGGEEQVLTDDEVGDCRGRRG
jgi:hypothetical protein